MIKKFSKPRAISFLICVIALWCFAAMEAQADIIIDNDDPETSSTETWAASSGENPFGPDSLWARDGATYTWTFTPIESGHHEVFMWWSGWPSRSTSIPVLIEHTGGPTTVTINQLENAGQWNSLGIYPFEAGTDYNITITSQPYPTSTCADAVRFVNVASPPNTPPVANDDTYTISQDSSDNMLDVLANDTDPDAGDTLTITETGTPNQGGTVTINATSDALIYSPAPGFIGTETFTYTIKDSEDATDQATVTISVQELETGIIIDNGDPETSSTETWAVSSGENPYGQDSLWARDGATYTWRFSPSESGDYEVFMWWSGWPSRSTSIPVRIEHTGGPTTVTINQLENAGQWNSLGIYPFEAGTDYNITITSQPYPTSTCADAVRFVNVASPPNTPPVANDDAYTVSQDSSDNVFDVLSNDTDPDAGDTLTITETGTPDEDGTVTINATSDALIYTPASGFVGTETFSYTIRDPEGATDQATVTVTVTAVSVNSPPVANDDSFNVDEDSSDNVLDVLANDTDPDAGDTLTITETGTPDEGGTVTINATSDALIYTPAPGFTGTETFTYTIKDPEDATDQATVTITVTAVSVNSPPVANDDSFNVDEDSSDNVLDVLSNDTDPDAGDTLTITETGTPDQGGTVTINATSDALIYTPAPGFTGTETFTYTIKDPEDATDQATVTITVTAVSVNSPPVANDDSFNVDEDSSDNVLDVLANDTDPDAGDTLTITETGTPDQGGTVTINATSDALIYTPAPGFTGTETFTYTIKDPADATDQATVTITVTTASINSPPVANDDSFNVNADSSDNVLDVLANDTDPDAGDTLTITETGTPDQGGTVTINATSDALIYTPAPGFTGTETFTYTIKDPEDATDQATVTITVQELGTGIIIDNGDPGTSSTETWAVSSGENPYGPDSLWARDGATYTWRFSPSESGDYEVFMWWSGWPSRSTSIPVRIEHTDGPTTVTIDQLENAGQWNSLGIYPFEAETDYNITITAQPYPSSTCADAVRFVNLLAPSNHSPVANDDAYTVSQDSSDNVFDVLANDTDPDAGDTLTITETGTPDQGGTVTINASSDALIYTPASGFVGTETFSYTIRDPEGATDQATVTVTVASETTETEHIYISYVYAHWISTLELALQDMGAIQENADLWRYVNPSLNKEFIIHIVRDVEGIIAAMKTEGANLIIGGHANYGLGPIPGSTQEKAQGYIEDILYIDDPRVLNISSPIFSVSLSGLITHQAYPNWQPIFQDGTSGIMPFGFGDPRGIPPYNYYITYQIPGDLTHYKVETVRFSAIERFPDCGSLPWYSPEGIPPDPNNPDHKQYFIILPEFFNSIGSWIQSQIIPDSYKGGYHYLPPGAGSNIALWNFRVTEPDNYTVYAWWPSSLDNTPTASYTINHNGAPTTILANQSINGGQWNELGEFYFDAGDYSVELTDETVMGNVMADAIRVVRAGNLPGYDVIESNFTARPLYGEAPLTVRFNNQSLGDITAHLWDFGDGTFDSITSDPEHTYIDPGIYTVSLTVSGPLGSSTKTKVGYIHVGQVTVPLQADFGIRASQEIEVPGEVMFRDSSIGQPISWLWNFGDGTGSSLENPSHTYTAPGIYTVTLTVTDADSNTSTETKENLIRVSIYDKKLDDVSPTSHYGNRTCLFRKEDDIAKSEMKFSRLFYDSCSSGVYYLDAIGHGTVFYTLVSAESWGHLLYLEGYLQGKSDEELWAIVQDYDPDKYDFYNFSQLPSTVLTLEPLAPAATVQVIKSPTVDKTFSSEKEAKISQLTYLPIEEIFEQLKEPDFFINKNYLHKAIFQTLNNRKAEAVALALSHIQSPKTRVLEGETVIQSSDFYVAKEILRVFSDESLERLMGLYASGNVLTRRNIIRVMGSMPGGAAVRNLLLDALDDKTSCVEDDGEIASEPMRICDEAYNQLVLRHMIKNVLRTIAPIHRIEVRDYYIERIKDHLIFDFSSQREREQKKKR